MTRVAGIVALDVGTRRIGVAATDAAGLTAQPLPVIETKPRRHQAACEAIAKVLKARSVVTVVVGLPLALDGSEGMAVRRTRAFVAELEKHLPPGCTVVEWDERMTSVAAERALSASGLDSRQQRGKVDSVAASLILQGYLDSLRAR